LQIVGFILGALGVAAIAAAVAYGAGFSAWPAIGIGAASFVLAQVLYVVWLAGMARAEARRKQSDASGSATEPRRNLAQKG
jgi:hypothetical protein